MLATREAARGGEEDGGEHAFIHRGGLGPAEAWERWDRAGGGNRGENEEREGGKVRDDDILYDWGWSVRLMLAEDSRGDEQCFRRKFSNGDRGRIQLAKGSGVAGLRTEMRGIAMSAAPSNQGSSSLTPASSAGVSLFALRAVVVVVGVRVAVGGSFAGLGRASRLTILAACERTCRRCLTASLGREMFTNWKSGILLGW
jgi:hypothetical protein